MSRYASAEPSRELIEEAICQICFMPMVDPRVLACCDEAFCMDCLAHLPDALCPNDRTPIDKADELPKFANKIALRRLGALLVFCPNRALGECDWKGPRENLEEHVTRTCQNTPCTQVAIGCTWRGRAREAEVHVNYTCLFKPKQPQVENSGVTVVNPGILARARWIWNQVQVASTGQMTGIDSP